MCYGAWFGVLSTVLPRSGDVRVCTRHFVLVISNRGSRSLTATPARVSYSPRVVSALVTVALVLVPVLLWVVVSQVPQVLMLVALPSAYALASSLLSAPLFTRFPHTSRADVPSQTISGVRALAADLGVDVDDVVWLATSAPIVSARFSSGTIRVVAPAPAGRYAGIGMAALALPTATAGFVRLSRLMALARLARAVVFVTGVVTLSAYVSVFAGVLFGLVFFAVSSLALNAVFDAPARSVVYAADSALTYALGEYYVAALDAVYRPDPVSPAERLYRIVRPQYGVYAPPERLSAAISWVR